MKHGLKNRNYFIGLQIIGVVNNMHEGELTVYIHPECKEIIDELANMAKKFESDFISGFIKNLINIPEVKKIIDDID